MKTKGYLLPAYNPNIIRAMLSMEFKEYTLPELQDNEVLIETALASVNPSDIAFMQGGYGIRKALPAVPGFEASGTIVKTGKDALHLTGKRVAAFVREHHQGTWSQHFIAAKEDVVLLEDGFPLDKAAMLSINPPTAFGLLEKVKEYGSTALIQNAAGSMIARWIRHWARQAGIETINVVRKEKQAAEMSRSTSHVLWRNDENFPHQLKTLAGKLRANVVLDAVAGNETAMYINALPEDRKGKIIIYGGLSGLPVGNIDPIPVIFHGKSIEGFNLMDWKSEKSFGEIQTIFQSVQKEKDREELFKIQAVFPATEMKQALRTYIKNMSKGKILIKFHG